MQYLFVIHSFWMNSSITIVCALELYSFIKVEARDLFLDPSSIFFSIYP